MPRQTVWIDVSRPFPFVAGAAVLAKVAYPDPHRQDERLCIAYMWALVRWRIIGRALKEPELATIAQPIIPAAFIPPHRSFLTTLKKGQENLEKRMITTKWIICPHLNALITGKVEDVEGKYPSINWLSELATVELGWKGKRNSISTLKDKAWAPTRPVSHIVAAYLHFQQLWCDKEDRDSSSLSVEFLQLFLDAPRLVAQIIDMAEEIRFDISRIEQFENL
jgi:hypothetical protein